MLKQERARAGLRMMAANSPRPLEKGALEEARHW